MAAESVLWSERSPAAPASRWLVRSVLLGFAMFAPMRLAAGPHLYDAGELLAASFALGGSHPPGQPLHALLTRAFLWLPFGPMAARAALFSSACALIAAALAARYTRALARELGASTNRSELAAAVSAFSLLAAPPVIRQALRVEVYALALALTLFACGSLLFWARGGGIGRLAIAAFVAGLAFAVHPPHALAIALAALGFVIAKPALLWPRSRLARGVGTALASGVLGLCSLAYLPLRAARGAPMWGEPLRARGFFAYVSGAAYAQNLGSHKGSLARNLLDYGNAWLAHGGAIVALGLLALLFSRPPQHGRRLLLGATLASALALLAACVQPFEPRNPDNVAYLAPAIGLAIAAAAATLATLLASRLRALPALGLALLAAQVPGWSRLSENLHPDLPVLETLSGSLLESAPPRALVVATTDFAAAALMQARAVDAARPDCALFVAGLSTSSWHWRELAHYPALAGGPVQAEGRDPHERYLRGAIVRAMPKVDVALERNAGFEFSALAGPYLIVSIRASAGAGRTRGSIGERLDGVIARDASESPSGDHGAGAAIVRDYQRHRAERLFAIGEWRSAVSVLASSLESLPDAQRIVLRAQAAGSTRRLPRTVKDPNAFLVSLEDMVRTSAAVLWAIGDETGARALLQAQFSRGDPRALLELAWIELAGGQRERARIVLAAYLRAAPDRGAEALELKRALAE